MKKKKDSPVTQKERKKLCQLHEKEKEKDLSITQKEKRFISYIKIKKKLPVK